MKLKIISKIKLRVAVSIAIIFVLCAFLVIAQDQDSSILPTPTQEGTSTPEIVSDLSIVENQQDIYVDLEDVQTVFLIEEDNITGEQNELIGEINSTDKQTEFIVGNDSENLEIDSIESSNSINTVDNFLDKNDYDYVDLRDLLNEYQIQQENNSAEVKEEPVEKNEINYVLYTGNKKEIETLVAEDAGLVIDLEETVVEEPNWEKEVTVSSNKHHENPVTAYSDILESETQNDIHVYWKEQKIELDYEKFDTNDNGLTDRISWVVPHLSEQNFLITLVDLNSTNSTPQILISSPSFSSNVTVSSVLLLFVINNTLDGTTNCNFSLLKSGNIVNTYLSNSNSISYNLSVDNGLYNWNLSCNDSVNSLYNSSTGNFAVSINNTPRITLTSNVSAALRNSTIGFTININTSAGPILYTVDWADGSSIFNSSTVNSSSINNVLSHLYQSAGTYIVKLTVLVAGVSYEKTSSITIVSLSSVIDNTDPNVDLISPTNDQVLQGSYANFSYFARDNIFVSNCTLSVYYYQNNNPLGTLVYSQTDKTVNNKSISVEIDDLSSGNYSWDVGCYDNSSNYDERNNDFEVINSNTYATYSEISLNLSEGDQEMLDDINSLIEKINLFLTKEDSYGLEEKEAIVDLELDDKITGYKKLLLQNKLDVSYNLGFMKDEVLKENRKKEIKDKLYEIEKEIPVDISVIDDYDYYKTESKVDIEYVAKEIMKLNGMSVNEATLNSIIDYLQNLQVIAVASNNVKHVKLDYQDYTNQITLVSKVLELKNNSFDFFVERIPDEVSDSKVSFVTSSKSLGNNYFQIQIGDLNDKKIVYYLNDEVDLKNIEKTSTILFSEDALTLKPLVGITGFVTSFSIQDYGTVGPYLIGFLFISALLFGGAYYTKQSGMVRMAEQHEGYRIVVDKLESASRFVQLKDFESAKSEYRTIKEKYLELPEDAKELSYTKIKKLQIDLDRKEAIELVKEFIQSVQQGRKEDARLIYNKIKLVYPRLPEGDRKKGYDKIAPYLSLLNSR